LDNPLKYSDFIQPDGSVTDLIGQLEKLSLEYETLQKKVTQDAVKLEASMKNVSGATAEGRKQTQAAAVEADKLAKTEEKLAFSKGETAKQITKLKEEQRQQNSINKLTAKLNKSAEGSYNKLSAQYSLNKIKLNQMSKAQRSGTVEGQKLEKESKALYERMKDLQEATGKNTLNVGNYGDALKGMPSILGRFGQGVAGVRAQFVKLLANPIVAVLALIAGAFAVIVSSMKRSEEGQDRLNKVMTVASSIFDNVMDILTELGVALFDTIPKALKSAGLSFQLWVTELKKDFTELKLRWNEFTGDVEDSEAAQAELAALDAKIAEMTSTQQGLNKEMAEGFSAAIDKAKNLASEIQADVIAAVALADAQARYNKTERLYLVENAKLNREAAAARGASEEMKKLDAQSSIALMEASFEFDQKVLANELDLAKQRESILRKQSDLAVDDIEAKKGIAEAAAEVFNLETRFDELRRQRARRLNMLREEALKQERERSKAYLQLNRLERAAVQRANDDIIASNASTFEQKRAALLENAQLEAQQVRKSTEIELQGLSRRKDLALINETDYALQRQVLEAKLADELLQINEGLSKEQAKIQVQQKAAQEKALEEVAKLKKEEQAMALSALDQEKELRLSEIDIMKTTEAEKTRLRLQAEKDRLQAVLALNAAGSKDLSDQQIQIMKNQIEKIDQELTGAVSSQEFDLYSLAGLNLSDEKKSAIDTSTQFAIDQVGQFLAAQTKAAERAVQNAQTQTQATRGRLDAEINAQREGYAANVEGARLEYEAAKKNQEKALKEQEKAQKAQIALDSVMQASNMFTASTKIWSQLGFPWAIPALAVMWGSFAASKVKAFQAAKQPVQEYGDGGLEFLQGGSHASGNDIPIGTTSSGKARRAEGGEALAIINKKHTSKYKRLLPAVIDSLNKGSFEKTFANSYDTQGLAVNVQGQRTDLRGLEKEVTAIREQGERQFFTDSNGNTVERYKNITRKHVN